MSSTSVRTPADNEKFQLEELFRSDDFGHLYSLFLAAPAFRPLLQAIVQIRVVIDADIIQGELRWRLGKRCKEDARSRLHEAIVAGVLVPFAPVFLKAEIEEHLDEIASETGASLSEAIEEWRSVEGYIHFYEPHSAPPKDPGNVDIDDLPYKYAYEELAVSAVYTRNRRHFQQLETPAITLSIDLALRQHARSGSVIGHVTLGSTISITISFEALKGLVQLMRWALRAFRRLPIGVQIGAAALAVAPLLHSKSRARIIEFVRSVVERLVRLKPILWPALAEFASQFFKAWTEITDTRKEITSALPRARKRTAIMHARVVCLMSKEPLTVAEIEQRMRNDGYKTHSPHFAKYLRRLLRADSHFVELSSGMWSIHQASIDTA